MHPEVLRQRLEILKQGRYNVMRLGEALQRLQSGDLPPRSLAITFDDGGYDFYAAGFPAIRRLRISRHCLSNNVLRQLSEADF